VKGTEVWGGRQALVWWCYCRTIWVKSSLRVGGGGGREVGELLKGLAGKRGLVML